MLVYIDANIRGFHNLVMPNLPSGANSHITAGISLERLASRIDGAAQIPIKGPHTAITGQFGCTITKDFYVSSTRTTFKRGMQGHFLEELTKDGVTKVKIYIEGVTESWTKDSQTGARAWVKNQWVPADCVGRGQPCKTDIADWPVTFEITNYDFEASAWLAETPDDTSTLGRTITVLITAFHSDPASFMGTKLQELVDKRDIKSIPHITLKGIQSAGV
jgi:hypothetical protein